MEERWSPPGVLRKYYPFECAMVDTALYLADEKGPFDAGPVDAMLRGPVIQLLHNTLPTNCLNSMCTLGFGNNKDFADVHPKTGEMIPRLVFGDGNPCSEVMFVGEGPGMGERNTYTPLVGTDEVLASKCVECENFEVCFKTIL